MAGSDAQKSSNKPISEYFPKRAPSSPVRGGTKSPLSFGSMYPQSPKTSYVASSPSGNASNGPMSYNQGDYYQQHPQQPGDYLLVSVGSSEILKGKQNLGVTFNFDKQDVIDFTKFSKMTMCRASEANS